MKRTSRRTPYVIVANPVSGSMTVKEKRKMLAPAARILEAPVHGLDTASAEALAEQLATDLGHVVVLVSAEKQGGELLPGAADPGLPLGVVLPGDGHGVAHGHPQYPGGFSPCQKSVCSRCPERQNASLSVTARTCLIASPPVSGIR